MSDEDRINSFNQLRATERLTKELTVIIKDPIPGIDLRAKEDNILEWHFVIHGKEDTPYYGGMYHGKLIFPSNFPFGPPKIIFLTPNGRFKMNERISFSLSDFHPEEWKPAFSITTVLQGITNSMHDSTDTFGSIETSESVKRQLSESSSIHNGKDQIFCQLFPQLCGRRVKDSEDNSSESSLSKNPKAFADAFSLVREKTLPPDEISRPPRTQSPMSTKITLPLTHLIPVLIERTPPPPPAETVKPDEILTLKKTVFCRVESSSPRKIIQTIGKVSPIPNETIQEQRTLTVPPHTTPPGTRPMVYTARYPGGQPSSSEVRPLQNVSLIPFIRSPIYPKQQNLGKNSQTLESIKLEERLPPIRSSGTTHPQRNLPSTPKEIIPRQTSSLEREICPDIEQIYPSIGVTTPVDREIFHRQEEDTNSLSLHNFQRNIRINSMIGVLVVLILVLGLLLIALLFTLTQ